MLKVISRVFFLTVIMFGSASIVSADVAPPPDYVEDCTIENQQGADETCISCNTYHGEPDACSEQYEPQGYEHRCNTAGASVWDEVWCKANETDGTGQGTTPPANDEVEDSTDEVDADESESGCGDDDNDEGLARASVVTNAAGAAICMLFAIGAVVLLRRRR